MLKTKDVMSLELQVPLANKNRTWRQAGLENLDLDLFQFSAYNF